MTKGKMKVFDLKVKEYHCKLIAGQLLSIKWKRMATLQSEDFLGGTSAKEPSCQCKRHPQVGKMPWARKWHLLQHSC